MSQLSEIFIGVKCSPILPDKALNIPMLNEAVNMLAGMANHLSTGDLAESFLDGMLEQQKPTSPLREAAKRFCDTVQTELLIQVTKTRLKDARLEPLCKSLEARRQTIRDLRNAIPMLRGEVAATPEIVMDAKSTRWRTAREIADACRNNLTTGAELKKIWDGRHGFYPSAKGLKGKQTKLYDAIEVLAKAVTHSDIRKADVARILAALGLRQPSQNL